MALAISIILLAITMVGILQYYKNMKLTEMDTTAKEIFIAAQNHLTRADASGELKRYRKDAFDTTETSVNEDALGTLIPSQPSDVPDGIAWPSTNKDYYYIKYNVNDSTVGIWKEAYCSICFLLAPLTRLLELMGITSSNTM